MKIVVIDDHPIIRSGVEQALLDFEDLTVVGSARNYQEGLLLIKEKKPNLVLVDLRMPGKGGLELVEEARKTRKDAKFVILTSYAAAEDVKKALQLKVEGYILKEALPEELINAIRLVGLGRKCYDPEVLTMLMEDDKEDDLERLTPREKEVLSALAGGLNNKAIANKFFLSESTVKKHVANILDKLYFEDRTQAALYGYSRGLGQNKEPQG